MGEATAEKENVDFRLTLPKHLYGLIEGEVPKTGALNVQERIRQILTEHYNGRVEA